MKNIFFIAILLLLNAGDSSSKSLHKLSIDTIGHPLAFGNTDILNGQLYFQDSFTESLWISDGTNAGSHILEYNQQPIQLNSYRQTLKSYNGFIYYINKSDGNTLWKTDGQSFEQVSSNSFSISKGLKIYSNHLIGALSDNSNGSLSDYSFVIIDENGVRDLDLGGLNDVYINTICILGEDNYVVNSFIDDSVNHLYQVKNGQTQALTENINNSSSFSLSLLNENTCFYKYSLADVNSPAFIAVEESGAVTKIETEINGEMVSTWKGIIKFNNSIYFEPKRERSNNENMFLYTYYNHALSENLNITLHFNQVIISSSDSFIYILEATQHIPDPVPPGFMGNKIIVLDSSYNEVYSFLTKGTYREILSNSLGEDTIIFDKSFSSIGFISNIETQVFNTHNLRLIRIFGDSQNTFLFGSDLNSVTGKLPIFVIKNHEVVSQNMDGLWYAPEHKSQGLSIHTGERVDGTQYLFASYYFFKDGVPFWIAGSTDLNFEKTLSLNMYEYTGSSPYIPNNPEHNHQRIEYGNLTLEALSCDSINLQVTLANDSSYNLDMERLGRLKGAINCID